MKRYYIEEKWDKPPMAYSPKDHRWDRYKFLFFVDKGEEVLVVSACRDYEHKDLLRMYEFHFGKLEVLELRGAGRMENCGDGVYCWFSVGFDFVTPEASRARIHELLIK